MLPASMTILAVRSPPMMARMEMNDRFSRQPGEDASAHFARLARDLWGCVNEVKNQAERETAITAIWRADMVRRLERVEGHVDTLRIAGGAQHKTSIFEVDLKTLVIVGTVVGAVVYGILQKASLP